MKKLVLLAGISGLLVAGMAMAAPTTAVPTACQYAGKVCTFNFKTISGTGGGAKNTVEYILISGSTPQRAQFSLPAGANVAKQGDCSNVQVQAVDLTSIIGGKHPMYNYFGNAGTSFCFNPAQSNDFRFDPSDAHWQLTPTPLD